MGNARGDTNPAGLLHPHGDGVQLFVLQNHQIHLALQQQQLIGLLAVAEEFVGWGGAHRGDQGLVTGLGR